MTPIKHSKKLAKNSKQLEYYQIKEQLGEGNFGVVFKAFHTPTMVPVAIKQISKQIIEEKNMQNKIENQISIMMRFDHQHVITLFEIIETDTDLFLVQEYAENGDLADYIRKRMYIDLPECRKIFQQLTAAVDYLHREMRISHRDIKPENILLTKNNNVKLADFELSGRLSDGQFLRTFCGTPSFAAPEIVSGKPYDGTMCDVWSLGVTLYNLLSGNLPFSDSYTPSLFRKIRTGEYEMDHQITDKDAQTLIKQMLQVKLENRITIKQMLQNRFFIKHMDESLKAQIKTQFDYSILDIDLDLLQQTNDCFHNHITPAQLSNIIETNRLSSKHAITYRILYNHQYDEDNHTLQVQKRAHYFANCNYTQYIECTLSQYLDHDHKDCFFVGINLCPVSEMMPEQLMRKLLGLLRENGYHWFFGKITVLQVFNREKQKMESKLRFQPGAGGYTFCIRQKNPSRHQELIMECTIYVAKGSSSELYYVLDVVCIAGEAAHFLWHTQCIADFLRNVFREKRFQ